MPYRLSTAPQAAPLAIDWTEAHRRGYQGTDYMAARLAHTLTPEQQTGAEAIRLEHWLRVTKLDAHDPRVLEARARLRPIRHLVPFVSGRWQEED